MIMCFVLLSVIGVVWFCIWCVVEIMCLVWLFVCRIEGWFIGWIFCVCWMIDWDGVVFVLVVFSIVEVRDCDVWFWFEIGVLVLFMVICVLVFCVNCLFLDLFVIGFVFNFFLISLVFGVVSCLMVMFFWVKLVVVMVVFNVKIKIGLRVFIVLNFLLLFEVYIFWLEIVMCLKNLIC